MSDVLKMCVICGKKIKPQKTDNGETYWDNGHNALPVKEGRCCDKCNQEKVIPARLDILFCDTCD